MIITVELGNLQLSDLNVRKTERDADIPGLAADIYARGLKQNLVVVPAVEDGRYEVVAGGRRLQALQLLAEQGLCNSFELIPVMVEPREQGRETSLAENVQRVAMNPADELEAYRTIIADAEAAGIAAPDERIAHCAKRFGKTVRHIEQRLRLAALAPLILDQLRQGAITLDAAQAFATTADTARQEAAWHTLSQWHGDSLRPAEIRRLLDSATIASTDRLARYVGREAYLADGGQVEPDLFASDDIEIWTDRAKVERLAREKLVAQAEQMSERLAPDTILPVPVAQTSVPYSLHQHLTCLYRTPPSSKEPVTRFLLIDAQGSALIDDYFYVASVRATAGAAIGEDGDRRLSQALIDELAMQRRDILAATIITNPALAYDIAAFRLALSAAGEPGNDAGVGMSVDRDGFGSGWTPRGGALEALASARLALDESWLEPAGMIDRFHVFRLLPADAKAGWLAFAVTRALKASVHGEIATGANIMSSRFMDELGALAGVDVRALWTPTVENYFGRLPGKDSLLGIAAELGADTSSWANAKKADIAKWVAAIVAGDIPGKIARVGRAWIPPVMRFAVPSAAARSRKTA